MTKMTKVSNSLFSRSRTKRCCADWIDMDMTCQEKNGGIIEKAEVLAITSMIMEIGSYPVRAVSVTGSFASAGTSHRQRNSSNMLSRITDSQPKAS